MSARNDNLDLSRSNRISRLKAPSSDFAENSYARYVPKRFAGLSARRQYQLEFRENRVFQTYLNSPVPVGYNVARINGFISWVESRKYFLGWTNQARYNRWCERRCELTNCGEIPF
jgi:hypothetical protein